MRRTPLALALALVVPATAHAAPPVASEGPAPVARSGEQERLQLEQDTRLDLSPQWRSYQAKRKGESFYQFVEKDFRRKRDIGRGLTFGGIGGMVVGVSLFAIGIPRQNQPIPLTIAGDVLMGIGAASTVAGAIVWTVFFRKMEKLEIVDYQGIALGRRVRLQSVSPTGFKLAF